MAPLEAMARTPQYHLRATSGHRPNLIAMPQGPEEPAASGGQMAHPGPAVEDHGRVLTASIQAAAFYRQAQQAVDTFDAVSALRHAIRADPAFELAVADLGAFTEAPSDAMSGGRQMNWERHHIEVVRTAAAGNLDRATDLLREHLASVGCDPVALRIVTELRERAGQRDGLDELTGHLPACHPVHRETHPGALPEEA
jgi:hypothetical protein